MDDVELAKDVGELLDMAVDVELLKKLVAVAPILDLRRRWGQGLLTGSECEYQMKVRMPGVLSDLKRLREGGAH